MKIGDQLKAARLLKKISKFDLAQKSNISLNLLSEIEQNTFFPDYKTFDKICNALEVSTNQIIYEILENEISLKSEGQKRTITEFQEKIEELTNHFYSFGDTPIMSEFEEILDDK